MDQQLNLDSPDVPTLCELSDGELEGVSGTQGVTSS
jgi:hypothetical protein